MQMPIASLTLLTLCLVAVPAGTQTPATPRSPSTVTLYSNGPANGDTDAWTINYGFAVTDSIYVQSVQAYASVTSISFWAWLYPNYCVTCSFISDYVSSVQVQVGTAPFDNSKFDGVVTSWVASNCVLNAYAYELCQETAVFRGPTLATGTGTTYWLTLQNAVASNSGIANTDPVYWDENSGVGCPSPGCPSSASENPIGTIPSESFTVLGYYTSTSDPAAGAAPGKNPSATPAPRPSALSSSGR
jgi:hypothetical protein